MNSKVLGTILIVGGIAVGAIVYFGNQAVNTKSDAELIREGMIQMQEDARREAEERAALTYSPPESCTGVRATIFGDACENEVYEGQPTIPWARGLTEPEASCASDAIIAKRTWQRAKRGSVYDPTTLRTDEWMLVDACDISSDLTLFVEGIDMEDPNLDAMTALKAYSAYKAN